MDINVLSYQLQTYVDDMRSNVNIEKDVFNAIDNESIIHRFQNMKSRRGQL